MEEEGPSRRCSTTEQSTQSCHQLQQKLDDSFISNARMKARFPEKRFRKQKKQKTKQNKTHKTNNKTIITKPSNFVFPAVTSLHF
jgi:hypothetical protein